MLSFKSLAVLGAVAFGAFTTAFAAPTAAAELATRDVAVKGVVGIVADVIAKVDIAIDPLRHCTRQNATVEAITPVVVAVKAIIGEGISQCNGLVGQPKEVILASVDVGVVVNVSVVAKVVADLLILVCGVIATVLAVVDVTLLAVVRPLLCSLLECVGGLVVIVLHLCSGLLAGVVVAVFGLIGACISVIVELKATIIASVFGIPC